MVTSPMVEPELRPNVITVDSTISAYVERIFRALESVESQPGNGIEDMRKLLNAVFEDPQIRANFAGAEIRYTAMCGEVAKAVLEAMGQSSESIGLMSIGDVDLPEFAREMAFGIVDRAHDYHKELIAKEGFGYDLSSKGSERARRSLLGYFDRHYGFSSVPGLMEKLVQNSTIVGGGMRGLDDIASAMVNVAAQANPPKRNRFLQPDNSFGTWHAITSLRSNKGVTADVHTIRTEQRDLLHLTPEIIRNCYQDNPFEPDLQDSWCITPVGNPSGTSIDSNQLAESCKTILEYNPDAIIILDCTYVRTLKPEVAVALMKGVVNDPEIMDRVVFVESFSKTHGFCGERVGSYFSANEDLYGGIQNINMVLSAGNGRHKSALALAFANPVEGQEETISQLHEFWGRERKGLHEYLLGDGRFNHLFATEQEHINLDHLDGPMGLYLFVKLQPEVNGRDVLMETGCLGVETKMGDDRYIRFAVGKIKVPTYAKYIKS